MLISIVLASSRATLVGLKTSNSDLIRKRMVTCVLGALSEAGTDQGYLNAAPLRGNLSRSRMMLSILRTSVESDQCSSGFNL